MHDSYLVGILSSQKPRDPDSGESAPDLEINHGDLSTMKIMKNRALELHQRKRKASFRHLAGSENLFVDGGNLKNLVLMNWPSKSSICNMNFSVHSHEP